MDEITTTKLNAESHLLLEQPLLRLPHELARKNFKVVQRACEHETKQLTTSLKATANASIAGQSVEETIASLDGMINRVQALKRKMATVHEESVTLHRQSRARIEHLNGLYSIPSLTDVKYDEWSRVRLNRLLVDYLLRMGYAESAKALAKEKEIEDLVDLKVFTQCHKIEESLKAGSTAEALAWCFENKALIKKTNFTLEFELRLQQYIEYRREEKLPEACQHAQKHLTPHVAISPTEVYQASGLLAFPSSTQVEPYRTMYSQKRWDHLADLFVKTHHELFSLPNRPLLHTALSAGLSALKTPSCHSAYASSSSNASSSTTTVCPICSTELNELARNLPYGHHSKSFVENDPVVLPNGRIYGRERLMQATARVGLEKGQVRDPTTQEIFEESKVRKVYIT